MSKLKKPTNGATPPPIVAAKMQKTNATPVNNNASQPLPKGVTEEVPTSKKSVSDYIKQKYGSESISPISSGLYKTDNTAVGEAYGRNADFSAINKRAKIAVDEAKAKGNQTGGQVEISLEKESLPPGTYLDRVMNHAYRQAEKAGIKTAGHFAAAFPELIKGADKDAIEYISKYGGGEKGLNKEGSMTNYGSRHILNYDKLPLTSGAHYEKMLKERDAEDATEKSKRPPIGTVTDMSGKSDENASYMNRGAYNTAQAAKGIKLSVKKK